MEAIEDGADPNITDNQGRTLLHLAIVIRDIQVAQQLINNNDVNAQDNINGSTPLHLAARYNIIGL